MARTIIEETSTITAKGQTTVPKSVRRRLGVDCGGKIVYRVEGSKVVLANATVEHRDPALEAFLHVIGRDLAHGRNIKDLPPELTKSMRKLAREVDVCAGQGS